MLLSLIITKPECVVDIRHLRLFLKTLEHGNITSAAADLGMSQPALSKHLSRLEEELEVKLLDRLPRGVQPSHFGKILGDYAKAIDANYRSALRHLDSAKDADRGEIVVGAGFYWLNGLLPEAVAQLASKYPQASVKITAGVPVDLINLLLSGEVDLVFGPVTFADTHKNLIETKSLIQTDTEVLVRKGHPANNGSDKTIEELAELDWVLPAGTFVRRIFDHIFEAHSLAAPKPRVEVNDVSCSLDIVARSDLATIATSVAPSGGAWENLNRLPCSEIATDRETGILKRKHSTIPPLCDKLTQILESLSLRHSRSLVPS